MNTSLDIVVKAAQAHASQLRRDAYAAKRAGRTSTGDSLMADARAITAAIAATRNVG